MEKGKGRVRNYVVTNKELFCDVLTRLLCQMHIPYVQVENEFHFNDKIYRFYNFDDSLVLNSGIVCVSLDGDKLISLNPQDLLLTRSGDDLARYLDPTQDVVVNSSEIKFQDKRPKRSGKLKQLIRQDNKIINHKLRNSYKQQGFRNRRNG